MTSLNALKGLPGFLYLASPYSQYAHGHDAAAYDVANIAAALMRQGFVVFCPIAHSHFIAQKGRLDPVNHDMWMGQDMAFIAAASSLVVAQLPGWESSVGVSAEIAEFKAAGKPVVYLNPRGYL